jgi:hypothetical protein
VLQRKKGREEGGGQTDRQTKELLPAVSLSFTLLRPFPQRKRRRQRQTKEPLLTVSLSFIFLLNLPISSSPPSLELHYSYKFFNSPDNRVDPRKRTALIRDWTK